MGKYWAAKEGETGEVAQFFQTTDSFHMGCKVGEGQIQDIDLLFMLRIIPFLFDRVRPGSFCKGKGRDGYGRWHRQL